MSLPHSTIKSMTDFYARKVSDLPEPDANPDGQYWVLGVQALQIQMTDLIGKEAYEVWAEAVWPAYKLASITWKEMYQQLHHALDVAWQGERNMFALVRAALYPEEPVPSAYGI